jgi:hypothetical protein
VAFSPRKALLSAIGFPWISLEPLVRIETYQWVTRHKRSKVFLKPFVRGGGRRLDGGSQSWRADKQDRSWGKLILIFDFQQ